MTAPPPDDGHRFRAFYAAHFDALLGFALRRVDHAEDAADVVGETFLVAWRRLDDVPAGEEARLWLYGVARKVLANQRRGTRRRDRLGDRLRSQASSRVGTWAGRRTCGRPTTLVTPDTADEVSRRLDVTEALRRLGDVDREVLTLAIWEELEPREIAEVLGVNAQVVRTRLSRARSRLRELLGDETGDEPAGAGHVRGVRAVLAPEETS